jgi:hypothetical protein
MKVLIDVCPTQLQAICRDLKSADCGISPDTERVLVRIAHVIQKECARQKTDIAQFEQCYVEEPV